MIKCKIVSSCVVELNGVEENLIDTESDLTGLENTEGFFITAEELEQREREAFEASRETHVVDTNAWDNEHFPQLKFKTADDYLKQRNREQSLSELVADGEKNGDYDDQAS